MCKICKGKSNKRIKSSSLNENEFISKSYSSFIQNDVLKLVLFSNLYKIFILNINNFNLTCLDFFQMLILICPDFPKSLIKKINYIQMMIKNKDKIGEKLNQVELLSNEVSLIELFLLTTIYFFYNGNYIY
jgi:hypothetical protein